MSFNDDRRNEIIRQMRELRESGTKEVFQLHVQAERATDWREYVRSQPMLFGIAASVVGFSAVRSVANTGASHVPASATEVGVTARGKSASMGLLSLIGGLATTVVRQWVTDYVKAQIGVKANAPYQSTRSEQRSHASS